MNISEYAEGMLGYKESLGFSKGTYYYYIKDFCDYFKRNGYSQFTEDTVNPWCVMRPTESPEGFRRRITPLREFSKYLCAIGVADYVIPSSVFPITHRKAPYIITDQELINLFTECDKEPFCMQSPCRHLIIRVIFRLIYCCGLRPNEGRELLQADFNEKESTLFIRKNKSHKERLIPVSNDVAIMCRNYLNELRTIFPDTEYMFPAPDGGVYSRRWLSDTFRRLWNASNPDSRAKGIRIYLLRHRFATAVFMKWLDEKADLYAKIPYLSAYMGHTQFADTAYYIHLFPEKLRSSSAVEWSRFSALIPEVEDCDE